MIPRYVFDEPGYEESRKSRLRCLWQHTPPQVWSNRRVLELGSGTGELGQALADLGADVISIDAREEYVAELRRRYGRPAYQRDLETWDGDEFGRFDAILCFGLLYHLANPAHLLSVFPRVAPTTYLETVVCDRRDPVCLLVDEHLSDHAYSGRGCRPSPAWITATCEEFGMSVKDISSSAANWKGNPDSLFDWMPQNDGAWHHGGVRLRRMFVLSLESREGSSTKEYVV